MEIEVTLSKDAVADMSDKPVVVLVLVASHDIERPVIDFHVIEEPALTNDTHEDCIPSGHMERDCAQHWWWDTKPPGPGIQPHLTRVGRQPVTIPKNKVVAL